MSARLNFFPLAQASQKALIALSQSCKKSSLGERLVEMVQLRVSQLNGCGLCIDMHWRDLIKQGVDPRHLNAIAGWREAPFFDARERAALGWAEAMNALPHRIATIRTPPIRHCASTSARKTSPSFAIPWPPSAPGT